MSVVHLAVDSYVDTEMYMHVCIYSSSQDLWYETPAWVNQHVRYYNEMIETLAKS